MGGQAVVVAGPLGIGRDTDRSSGGGTYRGGGGYGRDIDVLNRGEDTVANTILGTESHSSLASAPGLKLHHPNMSMIGGYVGLLERERDRDRDREIDRERERDRGER